MIRPDLTLPIPETITSAHFIGIGGSGMSGLARMFLDAGIRVSGSDRSDSAALRALAEGETSFREILRQQWNFSPSGAPREVEDYRVDLPDVKAIELVITPDIGGGSARASLDEWRLA